MNRKVRVKTQAFLVDNPLRDVAIRRHEEIDLENVSVNSIIAWMDGSKAVLLQMDEYAYMRAAIARNDWRRVLRCMQNHPANQLIQIFGYHSFAKSKVPMESSTVVDFSVVTVLERCIATIRPAAATVPLLTQIFAMRALLNVLSARPGRREFLSTHSVEAKGDDRNDAVDIFLGSRLTLFNTFLQSIPTSRTKSPFSEAMAVETPTPHGAEAVDTALLCLGALAQDPDCRELMALLLAKPVLAAAQICCDDACVVKNALKLLYNICYHCEAGQFTLLQLDAEVLIESARTTHAGDIDLARQARKLELALKRDGHRGYVEALIDRELRGEALEPELLEAPNLETFNDMGMVLRVMKIEAALKKPLLLQVAAESEADAKDDSSERDSEESSRVSDYPRYEAKQHQQRSRLASDDSWDMDSGGGSVGSLCK